MDLIVIKDYSEAIELLKREGEECGVVFSKLLELDPLERISLDTVITVLHRIKINVYNKKN